MKQIKKVFLIFMMTLLFTLNINNVVTLAQSTFQNQNISSDVKEMIGQMEIEWAREYEDYFGQNLKDISITANKISQNLQMLDSITDRKSAAVWLSVTPQKINVILTTSSNKPVMKTITEAKGDIFTQIQREFIQEVNNPISQNILGTYNTESTSYLKSAQQLYQWLIKPIEPYLEAENINTLIFSAGKGLRSFPFAALHDGKRFLVEKYSIAIVPTFNLTNLNLNQQKNNNPQVLAMGKSQFQYLAPLPGVKLEIPNITPRYWNGVGIIDQNVTLDQLKLEREKNDFSIIHLATHAEFEPGNPRESYIQLSDGKLTMDKIKELSWQQPPLDLLVLSACQTAIGDTQAELGFAGLAIQSGVKSALASLWSVSDLGTVALMTEFYKHLKFYQNISNKLLKSEALRQAQIDMINGNVYIQKGKLTDVDRSVSLPPELKDNMDVDFSHPFYWAGFTLIGSPW